MSDHTPIHWADSTCNPTEGCEGCELWNATRKSCYAGEQHVTFGAVRRGYSPTFEQITYWQGRMAAAAALADLQGRPPPRQALVERHAQADLCERHGRRPVQQRPLPIPPHGDNRERRKPSGPPPLLALVDQAPKRMAEFSAWLEAQGIPWPSNLWAGTSVTTADTTFRIDQLLYVGGDETIRFLSVEPQLEPLDLRPWLPSLDWIIQGGESGSLARRFDVAWAQELHGQCQEAETPYFLKQLGGHVIRAEDRIRLLQRHGGDWNEWPEDVPKLRQMPMSPTGQPEAAPKAGGSTNVSTLIARIDPDYKPVFDALRKPQQEALACYFLPHGSKKEALGPTRPNVITWYCPFACQHHFPTGHRYVINTYTACSNGCIYCYVPGYVESAPSVKKDFERLLDTDMEDLERFAVPPAPVHISNSTDPFQPLERKNRHTRYALEQILAHRGRFTTVTLLTKAPMVPVQDGYIDLFKQLTVSPVNPDDGKPFQGIPFQVQVSLAFWRDEACAAYDRNAPSISERREGILALTEAGIPVVLHIDPLFPRSPLPRSNKSMANFGLAEAQSLEDLENLIMFAKDAGVTHIVYSAARIVRPGGNLDKTMKSMLDVYREIAAQSNRSSRGIPGGCRYQPSNSTSLAPSWRFASGWA